MKIHTIILFSFLLISLNKLQSQNQNEEALEWYKKGVEFLNNDSDESAIDCFKEALNCDSLYADAYNEWGNTLLHIAVQAGDIDKMNESLSKMEAARHLYPDSTKYIHNAAVIKSEIGLMSKNIEVLQESLNLYESIKDKKDAPVMLYENWGNTLLLASKLEDSVPQNTDKVLALYTKGLEQRKSLNILYNTACVYSLLNQEKKAIEWLNDYFTYAQREIKQAEIDNDSDFDNIRNGELFIAFLNKHYGEKDGIDIYELRERHAIVEDVEDEPYRVVEEMPIYPNGKDAMVEFISNNLVIPEDGLKYGVDIEVIIRFVINKDGGLESPQVIRSSGFGSITSECSEEAIRVVKLFPKWIAGKQNKQAVSVYYRLPIQFQSEGYISF